MKGREGKSSSEINTNKRNDIERLMKTRQNDKAELRFRGQDTDKSMWKERQMREREEEEDT